MEIDLSSDEEEDVVHEEDDGGGGGYEDDADGGDDEYCDDAKEDEEAEEETDSDAEEEDEDEEADEEASSSNSDGENFELPPRSEKRLQLAIANKAGAESKKRKPKKAKKPKKKAKKAKKVKKDAVRADDFVDAKLAERLSLYNTQERSFVVTATPVLRLGSAEAVFAVLVLVVVPQRTSELEAVNGERELESKSHACSPLRLQSLPAEMSDDDVEKVRTQIAKTREASKKGIELGLRTVFFEQMYVTIRTAELDAPCANKVIGVEDFLSPLQQYQLRVRVLVDQLGSNQFQRFCVFPGDPELQAINTRASAAVVLTRHEHARFCLSVANPAYRVCTSTLPLLLNCAAILELVDYEPRHRTLYGMPPLNSAEEEAEFAAATALRNISAPIGVDAAELKRRAAVHAQNIENDLRATLVDNPFAQIEAVSLGNIEEPDGVDADANDLRGKKRTKFSGSGSDDEDDEDGLGSAEALGDYDRNDDHEPIYEPIYEPVSKRKAAETANATANAEASKKDQGECPPPEVDDGGALAAEQLSTLRELRQARDSSSRVRRERIKRIELAQATEKLEKSVRERSLVGEVARVGASRFCADFSCSSPELRAEYVWRPMAVRPGVRSLVPARKRTCNIPLNTREVTIGPPGFTAYNDNLTRRHFLPLMRNALVTCAMDTIVYDHDRTMVPLAIMSFQKHGLRRVATSRNLQILSSKTETTRACVHGIRPSMQRHGVNNAISEKDARANPPVFLVERMLAASLAMFDARIHDWILSFLSCGATRDQGHMSLRMTLVHHVRYEEQPASRRCNALVQSGFMPMEAMRASRFIQFTPQSRIPITMCALPLLPEAYWFVLPILGADLALLAVMEGVVDHLWRLLVGPSPHAVLLKNTLTALVLPMGDSRKSELAMQGEHNVGASVRVSLLVPHLRRNFLVHRAAGSYLKSAQLVYNVCTYALPRLLWSQRLPNAAQFFSVPTPVRIAVRLHDSNRYSSVSKSYASALQRFVAIFENLCDAFDTRTDQCYMARVGDAANAESFLVDDLRLCYPVSLESDLACTRLADDRLVFELTSTYRANANLRRLLCGGAEDGAFVLRGVDVVRTDTIEVLQNAFLRALASQINAGAAPRHALVLVNSAQEREHYKALVSAASLDATVFVFVAYDDVLQCSGDYQNWLVNELNYDANVAATTLADATILSSKAFVFVPRADRMPRELLSSVLNALTSNVFLSLRQLQARDSNRTELEKAVLEAYNAGGARFKPNIDEHDPENADAIYCRKKLRLGIALAPAGDYLFLGGLALTHGTHFGIGQERLRPSVIEDLYFATPVEQHQRVSWQPNVFYRRHGSSGGANVLVWSDESLRSRFIVGIKGVPLPEIPICPPEQLAFVRCSFPQQPPLVCTPAVTTHEQMQMELDRVLGFYVPLRLLTEESNTERVYHCTETLTASYEQYGKEPSNLWLLPESEVRADGLLDDPAVLMGQRMQPRSTTRLGIARRRIDSRVQERRSGYSSIGGGVRFIICDSVHDNYFLSRHETGTGSKTAAAAAVASKAEIPASTAPTVPFRRVPESELIAAARNNTVPQSLTYAVPESRAKLQLAQQKAELLASAEEANERRRLQQQQQKPTAKRAPQPTRNEFSVNYQRELSAVPRTGNWREQYKELRVRSRELRDRATAGFSLGSWVAFAAAPPMSAVLLGSIESSVDARFDARYVPPMSHCTNYELSLLRTRRTAASSGLSAFDCYYNGPTSALAYTLLQCAHVLTHADLAARIQPALPTTK